MCSSSCSSRAEIERLKEELHQAEVRAFNASAECVRLRGIEKAARDFVENKECFERFILLEQTTLLKAIPFPAV